MVARIFEMGFIFELLPIILLCIPILISVFALFTSTVKGSVACLLCFAINMIITVLCALLGVFAVEEVLIGTILMSISGVFLAVGTFFAPSTSEAKSLIAFSVLTFLIVVLSIFIDARDRYNQNVVLVNSETTAIYIVESANSEEPSNTLEAMMKEYATNNSIEVELRDDVKELYLEITTISSYYEDRNYNPPKIKDGNIADRYEYKLYINPNNFVIKEE